MSDEFSISLRFVALRTADLGRSREFYGNLLGLDVCGEKAGEFVQFGAGDAAVCLDLAMARSRPRRASPSEGSSSCVSAL
jgi:catechol-2,3-dioxygenase